eukprot:gb/GECG01003346.1/.p1 GENE.gb/GECG01003346.1/~~gb/GECG01003346.1/.p1  ORF type:complete len:242 (+),score=45.56 gb/GECG01003346.1/:1-726(+)
MQKRGGKSDKRGGTKGPVTYHAKPQPEKQAPPRKQNTVLTLKKATGESSWSPKPEAETESKETQPPALLSELFKASGNSNQSKASGQESSEKVDAPSASDLEAQLVQNVQTSKPAANSRSSQSDSAPSVNTLFSMASQGTLVGASEAKVATELEQQLPKTDQSSGKRHPKGAKDAPVAALSTAQPRSASRGEAVTYTMKELKKMQIPVINAMKLFVSAEYELHNEEGMRKAFFGWRVAEPT